MFQNEAVGIDEIGLSLFEGIEGGLTLCFQGGEQSVIARLLLSRCLRGEKRVIGGKPALNHL